MGKRVLLGIVVVIGAVACQASGPRLPPPGPNAVAVTVATEPPGGTVMVDGVAVGAAPQTVSLNPGPHRLRAVMSGYTPSPEQKIQVGATEPRQHTIHLVASH